MVFCILKKLIEQYCQLFYNCRENLNITSEHYFKHYFILTLQENNKSVSLRRKQIVTKQPRQFKAAAPPKAATQMAHNFLDTLCNNFSTTIRILNIGTLDLRMHYKFFYKIRMDKMKFDTQQYVTHQTERIS